MYKAVHSITTVTSYPDDVDADVSDLSDVYTLTLGCLRCMIYHTEYQIMLGWKTYKYDYETDKLPKADPTREKLYGRLKVAFGPLFPTANIFFVGWDWCYIGNRLQETQLTQILRQHRIGRWQAY